MRVAAYQYQPGPDIAANGRAIVRAVESAAGQGARFLMTQECALCGYPPEEVASVAALDFEAMGAAVEAVRAAARRCGIHVGLGTIRREKEKHHNSILLIGPDGAMQPPYDKRAVWGYDLNHFQPGANPGVYTVEGWRIGIRICFEVRCPEYFRELFKAGVDLACVSFCDVSASASPRRLEVIQAHLITRAVENAMFVLAVNSASKHQTAPTGVFDPDGNVAAAAPRDVEHLLVYDFERPRKSYGRDGRISISRALTGGAGGGEDRP